MRGSRFEKARIDHATFDGADLEWASFSGADLFAASFVNANLAEMVWQGATTGGIVRIGARHAAGLVFSPGVEIGTESALRRVVESTPSMGQALAVSPDGKWLAVARGFTVAVIDAFTGSVRMVLPSGTNCALTAIFSPDGRLLVAASKDGVIRVWGVRRGALPGHGEVGPHEEAWTCPSSAPSTSASNRGASRASGSGRRCAAPRCGAAHQSACRRGASSRTSRPVSDSPPRSSSRPVSPPKNTPCRSSPGG